MDLNAILGTIAIYAIPVVFAITLVPFLFTPFADVDSPTLTVTLDVQDGVIAATGTADVAVAGTDTSRTFTGITQTTIYRVFVTSGATTAYSSAATVTVNPAVTIGLWAIKKTEGALVPVYVVGQVVGGILGAGVIFIIARSSDIAWTANETGFASNGFGAHSPGKFTLGAAIITEIVFTAIFVSRVMFDWSLSGSKRPETLSI